MRSLFLRLVVLSSLLAPCAHAQRTPMQHAQIVAGFHASVKAAANYQIRLHSENPSESDPFANTTFTNQAGLSTAVPTPNQLVKLIPGQLYHITVTSPSWANADFHFNVPPGYALKLAESTQGRNARTLHLASAPSGGNGATTFDLEIQPIDGAVLLAAGYSNAPTLGEILWTIGVGRTQDGRYAGVLRWQQPGITQNLLNPASLIYCDPANSDVSVTRNSSGVIQNITTWAVKLEVEPDSGSNGYTLKARPPWEDSDVFREYRVYNPDSTWQNRVRIDLTSYDSDATRTDAWTLSTQNGVTQLEQQNGIRRIRLYSRSGPGTDERTEILEVDAGTSTAVVARTKRLYKTLYKTTPQQREELLQEIAEPTSYFDASGTDQTASSALNLTTTYTYFEDASKTGSYTKLKSIARPDGSWETYLYYGDANGDSADAARWGQLSTVLRSWRDSMDGTIPVTATNATTSNCHATLYDYAGERSAFAELPASTEIKILGTTTAKTTTSYAFWSNNDTLSSVANVSGPLPMRTEIIRSYSAASSYLETVRKVYHSTAHSEYAGRLYSQVNPDGTKISCNYVYDSSAGIVYENQIVGTATQATADSVQKTTHGSAALDPVWCVPGKSSLRQSERDAAGRPQAENTLGYATNGNWAQKDRLTRGYSNATGLQTGEQNLKGEGWSVDHANGRVRQKTDLLHGVATQNEFDAMSRITTSTSKGVSASGSYAAQADIVTTYSYDAADRPLSATTAAGGMTLPTSKTYNLAGLSVSATDARGLTATVAYADGGRTVTTTLPGGATKIEARYIDGTPKSATGTSVVAEYYSVTVNTDGTITKETRWGADTHTRWKSATTDWLGRTIREEQPTTTSGTILIKTHTYNSAGQLAKTSEVSKAGTSSPVATIADALYTYDPLGAKALSGLDLNQNGTLDLASLDRVTKTETTLTQLTVGTGDVRYVTRSLSYLYNQDNNSTAYLAGETWDIHMNWGESPRTRTFDIFTNATDATRESGGSVVTAKVNQPGSTADEITVSRNGVLQSKQNPQGQVTTFKYDALRRMTEQIDPRYGSGHPIKTAYYTINSSAAGAYAIYTTSTGHNGQVAWREDAAGNRTTYAYSTSDGRLISETNALSKAVYTRHNSRGQVIRQWGQTTYPVEYEFNSYGEKVKMRTFRNTTDYTASSWGAGTYPSTTGDATTWDFDAATGLLLAKADAAGRAVTYTYNARGQMKTREWSRRLDPNNSSSAHVKTTYAYDAFTGEQTGISYNDGTPNLVYTCDRLGHMTKVEQYFGMPGPSTSKLTTILARCVCGKLTQETLDPDYFNGRIVTYPLDNTGTGTKGRATGYRLGVGGSLGLELDVIYGYDTYGRFATLGLAGAQTYTYAYVANSNLIESVVDSGSGYWQKFTYESYRDHLAAIENKFNARELAHVDYQVDEVGRRKNVIHSGEIFARYAGLGHHTIWGYNDRSEVTSEVTYAGQTLTDTSLPLGGRNFGYAFDPIGNRTSASLDGTSASYTANELNQYSSRVVPGSVQVTGFAAPSATVTVNGSGGFSRVSNYFHKSVSASNGTNPLWLSLDLAASSGESFTRHAYVAKTPEEFSYDLDGNLLDDGRWRYMWDAENRLVAMETRADPLNILGCGVPRQRLTFAYDHLGRRIRKTVANWNGTAYVTAVDRKFVYHGWNLIAEYDVRTIFTLARTYVWGLDISRTLQDAGGVHGLLAMIDWTLNQTMSPAFDGNGNVLGLVRRSDGAIVAQYEYSPFGEPIRATGSYAQSNPFRFSTKFTDDETGLVYYGRRYYDARTGRWLSRDPKEELGGLHLYGFVGNNPIARWDKLGMAWNSNDDDDKIIVLPPFEVKGDRMPSLDDISPKEVLTVTIDESYSLGDGGMPLPPPETPLIPQIDVRNLRSPECAELFELLGYAKLMNDSYRPSQDGKIAGTSYVRLTNEQLTGPVVNWDLTALPLTTPSGFAASVYRNTETGEYVIAYRGTEFNTLRGAVTDGGTDAVTQPAGISSQYRHARNMGRDTPGPLHSNVLHVGHSLGGGLAATAALASGTQAVTINPAGISWLTALFNGLDLRNAPSQITTWGHRGEILGLLNRLPLVPDSNGTRRSLPAAPNAGNPATRHTMESVFKSIDHQMTQKGCLF